LGKAFHRRAPARQRRSGSRLAVCTAPKQKTLPPFGDRVFFDPAGPAVERQLLPFAESSPIVARTR
ncbi:hypothetical protein, partial [Burkholderia sp. BCCCDS05]|uniref:hypothetical protein n=1 Tax=Burkholderia sp. BCCCDS05 TaxID=3390232 RepID=UPI003D2ED401